MRAVTHGLLCAWEHMRVRGGTRVRALEHGQRACEHVRHRTRRMTGGVGSAELQAFASLLCLTAVGVVTVTGWLFVWLCLWCGRRGRLRWWQR